MGSSHIRCPFDPHEKGGVDELLQSNSDAANKEILNYVTANRLLAEQVRILSIYVENIQDPYRHTHSLQTNDQPRDQSLTQNNTATTHRMDKGRK